MYHLDFFEILNQVIKSQKDMKLFTWITYQFTSNQIEVNISYSKCSIKISENKYKRMIKRLVDLDYLMRISRGVYRLNPFVYVPYKADASELQKEWIELKKQK